MVSASNVILLLWEFFTPAFADGFSREFEWKQVPLGFQLLLPEWSPLVFFFPSLKPIYQSFDYCSKRTEYKWYHCHLPYILVLWQCIDTYSSFRFLLFSLCSPPGRQSPLFSKFFKNFIDYHKVWSSGWIRWSVFISKSLRILCISFFRTNSELGIYDLFVLSNLNVLHNSQWITFPTKSYLLFYTFSANFLNSLIIWLIVSSLSPHNVHLLFYCVLSIFS